MLPEIFPSSSCRTKTFRTGRREAGASPRLRPSDPPPGRSFWKDVVTQCGWHRRRSPVHSSTRSALTPALGRALRLDDDRPNAARVVVLSHGVWVRHFGSDASIIGRPIRLDGLVTVVGVMPEEFDYPRGTDLWLPVAPVLARASNQSVDAFRDVGVLFVVGRLRDGVTPTMAAAELHELSNQLQLEGAAPRFFTSVVVTPWLDHLLGPVRQALWALFGAVGVLLLIGCANVSGLMLTRVSLRYHEHRIRLALGATGSRLGRLWALEALILASAGGILGFVFSHWLAQGMRGSCTRRCPPPRGCLHQYTCRRVHVRSRCGSGAAVCRRTLPSGSLLDARPCSARCGAFREKWGSPAREIGPDDNSDRACVCFAHLGWSCLSKLPQPASTRSWLRTIECSDDECRTA